MGLVIAIAVIAGYGAAWWILGIVLTGRAAAPGYAIGLLAFALLLTAAWLRKRDESPERRRERAKRGHIIGIVTGVQAVLLVLALYVLRHASRTDLMAPVAAMIMGLHFLALARLFPAVVYYCTSGLLVGLGVAGLFLTAGNVRLLTVSIGAACLLWLTCIAVLIWPESRRSGT